MIQYETESMVFPEQEEAKLVVRLEEGELKGTRVLVEQLNFSEDNDEMSITYSIIENPADIEETDETFVQEFGVIMNDVMNRLINAAVEHEKELRDSDQ